MKTVVNFYSPYTKSSLARRFGVSLSTLRAWIKQTGIPAISRIPSNGKMFTQHQDVVDLHIVWFFVNHMDGGLDYTQFRENIVEAGLIRTPWVYWRKCTGRGDFLTALQDYYLPRAKDERVRELLMVLIDYVQQEYEK